MSKKPSWEEQMNMAKLVVVEKWLTQIGLQVQQDPVIIKGFFNGIKVDGGIIFYNARRTSVADLLHEAGHVAIIPGKLRRLLNSSSGMFIELGSLKYHEDTAIAWSYCAAIHLGIKPELLFELGFNSPETIIRDLKLSENSESPRHVGATSLYEIGLLDKISDFPKLRVWLNNW